MTRILATAAALAMTVAFALPTQATAAEKRADGARTDTTIQTDVSAQRRKHSRSHRHHSHRHAHRHHRHRYHSHYRAPRAYYGSPYYAYGPRYYRPYYGPSVGIGIGPFGFGVW